MRVKDCMTKQVISVGAGEPVSVAARLMARYNLGALPVRGTDGQLEGMLTDRDIVLRCIAAERSPKAVRVREVMTRSVAAAAPDTDATAAAGIMAARQVRRLPVTEEGRLVGMVSLADLSRRPDYMMEAAEALEDICAGVRHMDGQEL
ncbi:MAG: CBS domain-containing protein [Firmicutes bacterium]|nr:CBS domain-containing protein [Bacillota bacterium]MDY2808408.1 CBS domain-containing protein [Oscillospiraceae bacterium]